MKRKSVFAVLALVLCLGTLLAASGNVDKKGMVCMINDEVLNKPGVAVEHNGKTYYGCCEMCLEKIKKDPSKYVTANDPVSGQKVDKADAFIYGLDGKAYYFANEANRKSFAENPERYLKK